MTRMALCCAVLCRYAKTYHPTKYQQVSSRWECRQGMFAVRESWLFIGTPSVTLALSALTAAFVMLAVMLAAMFAASNP
jgi:hypothetical protein